MCTLLCYGARVRSIYKVHIFSTKPCQLLGHRWWLTAAPAKYGFAFDRVSQFELAQFEADARASKHAFNLEVQRRPEGSTINSHAREGVGHGKRGDPRSEGPAVS